MSLPPSPRVSVEERNPVSDEAAQPEEYHDGETGFQIGGYPQDVISSVVERSLEPSQIEMVLFRRNLHIPAGKPHGNQIGSGWTEGAAAIVDLDEIAFSQLMTQELGVISILAQFFEQSYRGFTVSLRSSRNDKGGVFSPLVQFLCHSDRVSPFATIDLIRKIGQAQGLPLHTVVGYRLNADSSTVGATLVVARERAIGVTGARGLILVNCEEEIRFGRMDHHRQRQFVKPDL